MRVSPGMFLTVLVGMIAIAGCAHAPQTTNGATVAALPKSNPVSSDISAARNVAAPVPEGPLFEGVAYRRIIKDGDRPMVAHVIEIDLSSARYRLGVTPADTSRGMEHTAKLTTAYLDEVDALLALNASYFLPFAGGSPAGDDYYPKVGDPVSVSGAAISGGRVVSPIETDLDIRVNAIVCFAGLRIAIEDGQSCPAGYPDGVAAGPRLLASGVRRPFTAFDNNYAVSAHPRTAIGVDKTGGKAFIVAVDGRQADYSVGASLDQLTDLFIGLGATEAINLDGGGSTTLTVAGKSGTPILLNRPIHTGVPGRERPVPNHIVLLPAAR